MYAFLYNTSRCIHTYMCVRARVLVPACVRVFSHVCVCVFVSCA